MFYLFSSDSTPRYKTDILDVLCYPERHIFRFRYQDQYVSDEVKQLVGKKKPPKNESGIIIYAEVQSKGPYREFDFYPIRQVTIERVFVKGSIYYVDFRLGAFVDYGRGAQAEKSKSEYQTNLNALKLHPLPLLQEDETHKWGKVWDIASKTITDYDDKSAEKQLTHGYYLSYEVKSSLGEVLGTDPIVWESVVNTLSRSPSMKSSLFFLISGFYRVRRRWRVGKHRETLIESFDDGWNTKYPFPMGKRVVLKLLFYRPEDSPNIYPQRLAVNVDKDVLAGISQQEILVQSHYNEERVELAFKRVFDSVLSALSIEYKPDENAGSQKVLTPHPFFVINVTVPKRILIFIMLGLLLAPFLLTLSPDYLVHIGKGQIFQTYAKDVGDFIARNAGDLATYSKALAASVTLIAGYLGFRRLPIGK
jgi:hypothetical protein